MFKKTFMIAAFGLLMAATMSEAQVVIRVGPPPPVVERYGPPPRPGWAWRGGYHRWDGQRYVWVPGSWGRPPRRGAIWVPGGYNHRGDGWRYRRGYWR